MAATATRALKMTLSHTSGVVSGPIWSRFWIVSGAREPFLGRSPRFSPPPRLLVRREADKSLQSQHRQSVSVFIVPCKHDRLPPLSVCQHVVRVASAAGVVAARIRAERRGQFQGGVMLM